MPRELESEQCDELVAVMTKHMASSNRSRNIVVLGVLAFLLLCLGLCLFVAFPYTPFYKSVIASGLPDPDRGFQTGTVTGTDAYVWDCYQGKRIVIYRHSSELLFTPFTRVEAPCGTITKIEEDIQSEPVRRDLDPKSFWR